MKKAPKGGGGGGGTTRHTGTAKKSVAAPALPPCLVPSCDQPEPGVARKCSSFGCSGYICTKHDPTSYEVVNIIAPCSACGSVRCCGCDEFQQCVSCGDFVCIDCAEDRMVECNDCSSPVCETVSAQSGGGNKAAGGAPRCALDCTMPGCSSQLCVSCPLECSFCDNKGMCGGCTRICGAAGCGRVICRSDLARFAAVCRACNWLWCVVCAAASPTGCPRCGASLTHLASAQQLARMLVAFGISPAQFSAKSGEVMLQLVADAARATRDYVEQKRLGYVPADGVAAAAAAAAVAGSTKGQMTFLVEVSPPVSGVARLMLGGRRIGADVYPSDDPSAVITRYFVRQAAGGAAAQFATLRTGVLAKLPGYDRTRKACAELAPGHGLCAVNYMLGIVSQVAEFQEGSGSGVGGVVTEPAPSLGRPVGAWGGVGDDSSIGGSGGGAGRSDSTSGGGDDGRNVGHSNGAGGAGVTADDHGVVKGSSRLAEVEMDAIDFPDKQAPGKSGKKKKKEGRTKPGKASAQSPYATAAPTAASEPVRAPAPAAALAPVPVPAINEPTPWPELRAFVGSVLLHGASTTLWELKRQFRERLDEGLIDGCHEGDCLETTRQLAFLSGIEFSAEEEAAAATAVAEAAEKEANVVATNSYGADAAAGAAPVASGQPRSAQSQAPAAAAATNKGSSGNGGSRSTAGAYGGSNWSGDDSDSDGGGRASGAGQHRWLAGAAGSSYRLPADSGLEDTAFTRRMMDGIRRDDAKTLEEMLDTLKGKAGMAKERKVMKKHIRRIQADAEIAKAQRIEAHRLRRAKEVAAGAAAAATPAGLEFVPSASAVYHAAPATYQPLPPVTATVSAPAATYATASPLERASMMPTAAPGVPLYGRVPSVPGRGGGGPYGYLSLTRPGKRDIKFAMPVYHGIAGWLIGTGGQRIKAILRRTGATVRVVPGFVGHRNDTPQEVHIMGTAEAVNAAFDIIQAALETAPAPKGPPGAAIAAAAAAGAAAVSSAAAAPIEAARRRERTVSVGIGGGSAAAAAPEPRSQLSPPPSAQPLPAPLGWGDPSGDTNRMIEMLHGRRPLPAPAAALLPPPATPPAPEPAYPAATTPPPLHYPYGYAEPELEKSSFEAITAGFGRGGGSSRIPFTAMGRLADGAGGGAFAQVPGLDGGTFSLGPTISGGGSGAPSGITGAGATPGNTGAASTVSGNHGGSPGGGLFGSNPFANIEGFDFLGGGGGSSSSGGGRFAKATAIFSASVPDTLATVGGGTFAGIGCGGGNVAFAGSGNGGGGGGSGDAVVVDDLESFLTELGLSDYAAAFAEHGWDLDGVMDADVESDFEEIGLLKGHQVRLRNGLESCRQQMQQAQAERREQEAAAAAAAAAAAGALAGAGGAGGAGGDRSGERPVDDADICVVCMDARRNAVIMPCSHLCVCSPCCDLLSNGLCPVCRQKYTSFIKNIHS